MALLHFLILLAASASAQPYCDNMYATTCAPGAVANQVDGLKIDAALASIKEKYVGQFQALVSGADNAYFRQMTTQVLGYGNAIECQLTDAASQTTCHRKMGEGLFNLAATKMTSQSNFQAPRGINMADLETLTENSQFSAVLAQMKGDVSAYFGDDRIAQKVETDIYPGVKTRLLAVIDRLQIEPTKKQQMIDKVKGITLNGASCGERYGPGQERTNLDIDLIQNAFYSPTKNTFTICNGLMLRGQSETELMHVVAHELAHSIDPCCMEQGSPHMRINFDDRDLGRAERQYPIPELVACLRHDQSIDSQRDDGFVGLGGLGRMVFGHDKIFCSNDQIGESVADWFAAEVVADHIHTTATTPGEAAKKVSEIFSFSCGSNRPNGFLVHPHPADRINKIVMRNPTIRSAMGCGAPQGGGYCDGSNPVPRTDARPTPPPLRGTIPPPETTQ